MDLAEILAILEANTQNGTLTLPPDALQSPPIEEVFSDYLLNLPLVIEQASIIPVVDQNVTVAGQGASFPFENSFVTATFTAPGGVAAMSLFADGFANQTTRWNFSDAFPVLSDTFYKELEFTKAELTLFSSNVSVTQPAGLFFSGTQKLTGTLGTIAKLLKSDELKLNGALRVVGEPTPPTAVPEMDLQDPKPGIEFGMQFIYHLIDGSALTEDRVTHEQTTVPVPEMRLISSIAVDTEQGSETIEVETHFAPLVDLLLFQADMDKVLVVSQAALNQLAEDINLARLLPPQLPLVNRFRLGDWSMAVIPDLLLISTITIGVGISESWTIIPKYFTLQDIYLNFSISFLSDNPETDAALTATVKILDGDAAFTMVVDAQYPSYVVRGFLDDGTEVDLIALVTWFLGETIADSLPCSDLRVIVMNLLIDSRNSTFTFDTVIRSNCSFDLGVVAFNLTQIDFNFKYVAGKATGGFKAKFWVIPPGTTSPVSQQLFEDPPEGAVAMQVSAAYNGAENGWSFRGGLAPDEQIDLTAIVKRYLPEPYWAFIPTSVVINQLDVGFETGKSQSYDFSIGAEWTIGILNTTIGGLVKIRSFEEGRERKDEGEIQGFLRFGGSDDEGGLEFKVKQRFDDKLEEYEFEFLGWQAKLSSKAAQKTLTFHAIDEKTLGEMIEVLINAVIPGADITLAAPWNVLNSIKVKDFEFIVDFSENSIPLTAGFTYPLRINLGFCSIDGIGLEYDVQSGEVNFQILNGQFLGQSIDEPLEWDIVHPETTPAVPGQGSELFRLDFLGMGQHMAVVDTATHALAPVPASVTAAIAQLTEAFKQEGNLTLRFNEATDWLIATRFTVLQAVDLAAIFYDPYLYGLMVSVTGSKAGEKLPIFNGLVFEILYKKINDTIGMWQIDLTLPYYIRNLEFGAVSVTLPSMKLQVYTNGDFLVDFGFPVNDDFSRSFSIQAFPFVGSGGVYFGKLSAATSNVTPQVTTGGFSPVITFGLGLRFGLGKDIKYGPLKAGLSVTIQGVLEGVFAWYNPYPTSLTAGSIGEAQLARVGSRQLTASGSDSSFYYLIQARVSLVGKMYGTVDFKIVKATLDIEIRVSIRLALESYRAIDVAFEARVSLTLRVRVNLGLFKVTIKLTFSMTLKFSTTIGSNSVPPWGQTTLLRQTSFMRRLDASPDEECQGVPTMKWQPVLLDKAVTLPVMFVPQFTAGTAGALNADSPRKPYVVAMTYVDSTKSTDQSAPLPPFEEIAQATLFWTLNAFLNSGKDNTTLEQLLQEDITIDQLNEIFCYLTQDGVEPFTEDEVFDFLKNYFHFFVDIAPDTGDDRDVSIFPIMPLLKLTTDTGVDVDFQTQTIVGNEYLATVKAYFEELAVRYKSPAEKANSQSSREPVEPDEKSLASFIFLDFFAMLARSTIQDAIGLLQSSEEPVEPDESLTAFVQRNTRLAIDVVSLAMANERRPLRAGVQLHVIGVTYTVKRGDTLQAIAAKFNVDILELRLANPQIENGLRPAAVIRLPEINFTTSETNPESLLTISRIYGVSVAKLAQANQDVAELFRAGEFLAAPYAQQENVAKLASRLAHDGKFNELSGLAARVLLQGLRPPSPPDSPQAGATAPLYELTGQQIDASDLTVGSRIRLRVPIDASSWFTLRDDGEFLTYIVNAEAAAILDSLGTAPFGPEAKSQTVELLRIEPRRFTLPTSIIWHSPNPAVTTDPNCGLDKAIEPTLWKFPSELMDVITGPQALQPEVELWTQRQEAPGQQEYPRELVECYIWATTIEIQVRQTASGDEVFLPNTYELTGIDSGGSMLLENLLVWYARASAPSIYDLQILYPPNPGAAGQTEPPVGLQSDSDPTFFLLQTNLSTASQPPQVSAALASRLAAYSPQSDPLGQYDIEFLKLLWEFSVVNSGGYVLYYESTANEGLPGYLFSQDGVARLTLLITYASNDNVLQNYLNTVVIDQVIDTENELVYIAPKSQTVSNFKLSDNESLADVAARYRVKVSQLATQYNNAHATLAEGKHMRVPPLTYRVRAGDSLETIARNANVTPQSIAALNPDRNLTDLSDVRFLRVPETVWRVKAGDTFASLAERFSTTVVTLAHANKTVPGLVEGSLEFDDRLEQAIATIPAGNVAFNFTRPVPVISSDPAIAPQGQLDELYNLLGYRIKEGNGFIGTNSALPISPVTPDESDQWIYDSVVPVFPFVTPLPDPTEGVPDPRQDPYNGVGSKVELNFNWQDLFGNWLDSDYQNPSWPDQEFSIGYIDDLMPLDQWPSVNTDYVIARGGDGNPELSVTLRFNADLYLPADDQEPAQDMALTDLGKFRTIYYQLTQADVTVTLSSTMRPVTPVAAESPKDVMVNFALAIINFLTVVSEGGSPSQPPADAAFSQPVADENSQNLFALVVRVQITRSLDLVADEFKDIPSVSKVSSRVPANAGDAGQTALEAEPAPPLSLQEFALQLENAFPSLKVLVAAPKKSLGEASEEIWIARFNETPTGIAFTIDGQNPSFFAVPPLARNLLSRPDVLVYPYVPGKFIGDSSSITTSQNSVDLDQMGRDFLTAMEEVLGPQFSAQTWKLEYGSGGKSNPSDPPDPETTPYEAIVAAKELLANAISNRVVNVFETSGSPEGLADAREQLRQQLLVKLTAAFTVDVVMQYPVEVTHSQYAADDPFAPRLFGKPVTDNPEDPAAVEKKNAFSFSTGTFSLAKRPTGTRLTFSFDTNTEQQGKGGAQVDDVFTIDLYHQINALEHEIHPVEGIGGYLASSWLTFVLPGTIDTPGEQPTLVPLGQQTIPVPLRAYPTPPSLSEQTFIPLVKQFVGDANEVEAAGEQLLLQARAWKYVCQYEYVGAAHDKILANIKLNVPATEVVQATFSDADNPDLFAALIQFTYAYPGIAKDLDEFLVTGGNTQTAFNAISSFAWLAQRAANAWTTWQDDSVLHQTTPPESPEYHFVITQRAQLVHDVNALVVAVTADGALRLPALPKIEIAGYKTEPWTTLGGPSDDDSAYYFFRSLDDLQILTYEDGRNLSTRGLAFPEFDVLKVENAWAGAAVKRNEDLLPNEITNPDFVLQSPVVRFVNVLTPLLDPDVEIDIAEFTTQRPASLAQFLSNFLIAFFDEAQTIGNESRTIRLNASYGYGLDSTAGSTSEEMPDLNITLPILLTTPTSISILKQNLGPTSPFVSSVSATITAWVNQNDPSGFHDSGRLWFDLSVYSSLSETQLPVLRMRRLFLETALLLVP